MLLIFKGSRSGVRGVCSARGLGSLAEVILHTVLTSPIFTYIHWLCHASRGMTPRQGDLSDIIEAISETTQATQPGHVDMY